LYSLAEALGTWSGAKWASVAAFLLTSLWLNYHFVRRARQVIASHPHWSTETREPTSPSIMGGYFSFGALTCSLLLGLVINQLLMFRLGYPAFMILLLGVAIPLLFVLDWLSGKPHAIWRLPWFEVLFTAVSVPFLVAWLAGSAAWWVRVYSLPSAVEVDPRGQTRKPARGPAGSDPSIRGWCADPEKWRVGRDPLRVAVALSGGGYRAAVSHAGVLAALDAQCLPIAYLTTVSGGSIVGAAYALGVPPAEFARLLRQRRPGLANDLVSIEGFLREWVMAWSSNAETYSRHFKRVFFGNATLADLPDRPALLINATDLESASGQAREVFFKNRAPWIRIGGKSLDNITAIGDIVAASGAFPGAFQPKVVVWPDATPGTRATERKFIDGGLVENLGVEGLWRYLTMARPEGMEPPLLPHLLIIVDASQRGRAQLVPYKMELTQLLARSQGISYDELHAHLYAQLTGGTGFRTSLGGDLPRVFSVAYEALDVRFGGRDPKQLLTVIIPTTARETGDLLAPRGDCALMPGESAAQVQQSVSGLDTLAELAPHDVERAFWLGYVLGTLAGPALECAQVRIRSGGLECPVPAARATRPTCPSLAQAFGENVAAGRRGKP